LEADDIFEGTGTDVLVVSDRPLLAISAFVDLERVIASKSRDSVYENSGTRAHQSSKYRILNRIRMMK
jgi:hypothetical protein